MTAQLLLLLLLISDGVQLNLSVTVGDLLVFGAICGGILALGRRVWEHDIMWRQFARAKGLHPGAPKKDFEED
jgi:hypothetical protein